VQTDDRQVLIPDTLMVPFQKKKEEKRLTDGLMFGWFLNTERPGIIS